PLVATRDLQARAEFGEVRDGEFHVVRFFATGVSCARANSFTSNRNASTSASRTDASRPWIKRGTLLSSHTERPTDTGHSSTGIPPMVATFGCAFLHLHAYCVASGP